MSEIKLARTAGLLYLIIIITAGFAEGFVRGEMVSMADPALTAANIDGARDLWGMGIIADVIAFTCDAVVAVLFYHLLKPVSKPLAMAMAVLRLIAHPAVAMANLINMASPLWLLGGSGSEQLVANALHAHHMGYLIAGAMFGVHCILLGYMLVKSLSFPSWLGFLISIAGVTYLIESFGGILFPQHEETLQMVVVVPAVIAELSLCLFLLIKGVIQQPKAE